MKHLSRNHSDNQSREYQICTRCVMDTTDPEISFDDCGVCNHCHKYDYVIKQNILSNLRGKADINAIIARIKKDGAKNEYDCIIGVSGGVDSTFVAYTTKKFGLRPLAVHLDNGWDSELSVKNIENALKILDIQLYTYVIEWQEVKDLQLAFLKASTPDGEIPTDHAIVSLLYHTASRMGLKYVIFGYNMRTESHLPPAWSQGWFDLNYIKNVHRKFGILKLKTFPHMSLWTYFWYKQNLRSFNILDYLDYSKKNAMQELESTLGWRYYGGKHCESIYTRFYQGYILIKKFGYDKRRSHLSSLICSGEIMRDHALEELKNAPYPVEVQESDKEYVLKKLGLSESKFDALMHIEDKTYYDYSFYGVLTKTKIYKTAHALYRLVNSMRNRLI